MKQQNLLTKMLLLFALVVGSVTSVWAETAGFTVTSSNRPAGSTGLTVTGTFTGTQNETWDFTLTGSLATKNPSQSYQVSYYWQIGANGNQTTAVFSTSGISGTITKISVDCCAYGGYGTASVTVGGSAFGEAQTMPKWNGNKSGVEAGGILDFEGSASGNIVVTIAPTAEDGRAIYLHSITVTYTDDQTSDSPLSSIAVSGSFKTEFNQGETFTHDGAIVTATYKDNSKRVVTNSAEFSVPDMTTLGTKTVTVSYTENEITKSTSYDITVNEYVQPTTITLEISQSLFPGVTFNSNSQTSESTISTTFDNVVMTINKGNSGTYVNDGEFRCYANTQLIFDAPEGYYLKKIEFTKGSSWGMNSATPGTLSSQTWTAASNTTTVTFGFSGRTDIKGVTITLVKTATITLAAACTDGEKYFGTYSNESAFVVPSDLTVSAVSVSGGKLVVTNYETDAIVPANTGVMVSSATAGDHTVLLSSETGTEISGNMLKASGDAGISADNMNEDDTTFYRLTMHNGTQIGFWWGAENGAVFNLGANKAYLAVPESAGAPAMGMWIDDEQATGISQHLTPNTQQRTYYDLSGRRVAQPTKGLYILNGKKVLVK